MSFDRVAWIYDQLAGLVFGSQWDQVQQAPVGNLAGKSRVLIVGGGTGLLLDALQDVEKIVFLELSEKMIARSRNRGSHPRVDYVHADFFQWETSEKFDAIVMPFFLDCFGTEKLEGAIFKARTHLTENGELHVIDFQSASWWKNSLIHVMYLFFRLFSSLEGKTLLNIDGAIRNAQFGQKSESFLCDKWIFYSVYQPNRIT
ncbi:class I SAM-dependent methyltransferase [Marinoscillum sp. 108]|uniref:class I SAM-dependent methyltransferase n=1 Tax=Marinoscillum sp. 108 TaxID=2653151 RepID=UPI0012F4036B|nr:class I SAM-dependent methyltransferase [Marinoscillum sp. 108]VXD17626.1 Ubiquinone/menaquinone biosynthesis C-methylase UbiE [Marinoscillum sp. 108]